MKKYHGKVCVMQAPPIITDEDICDCFGRHDNEEGPDHCHLEEDD